MRKWCISVITAVAVFGAVPIWAQSAPVDMGKAKFMWTWSQGAGGMVEAWRFTCVQTGQTAPLVKSIADPAARTALLSAVISAEGDYSCTLAATNGAGSSDETAPVTFQARKVPVAATGLTLSPK